jgi:hypothetical protein
VRFWWRIQRQTQGRISAACGFLWTISIAAFLTHLREIAMSEAEQPDDWKQKSALYLSIGQGISLWASMEGTLVSIAARLLSTSEQKAGLVFYSISNFHSWLNIIDELFLMEDSYAKHRDSWIKQTENLRSMNDTRVRLAHHTVWDYWEMPVALRPGRFDSRSKSRKHSPLADSEIIKFSQRVLDVDRALTALLQAMRQPPSLPSTTSSPTGDPPKEDAQ